MKKIVINSIIVNRLFIAGLILLVGGSIYGCYALQNFLAARTIETNHAKIDVQYGRDELQNMTTLDNYLKDHADEVSRAASVVGESKQYKYQDQIVKDLNTFAQQANVKILGFDFTAPSTSTTAKAATGLKTIQASVSLQNPVNYRSFLSFLKLVEQNLTKMQVIDIAVTPVDDNPSNINSPVIKLEVYVQ